jgi:lysophospholipase L1-like esterase
MSRSRFICAVIAVLIIFAATGLGVSLAVNHSDSRHGIELPPEGADVLVIGDSWSVGYSADDGQGWVDVLGAATGWKITKDAQGGTGYIANLTGKGEPFPVRVGKLDLPTAPKLILIEGGINDAWAPYSTKLDRAVAQTIAAIRDRFGDAPIVMIGPGTAAWPADRRTTQVDRKLEGDARRLHVEYISPLQEGWETQSNFNRFIDSTTGHPGNFGHAVFAADVLAALHTRSVAP